MARDGVTGLAVCSRRVAWAPCVPMAAACVIDLEKPSRHFFGRSPFPPAFDRFHDRIQTGWVMEALAGAALAGILWPWLHRRKRGGLGTVRGRLRGGHDMATFDARSTLDTAGGRVEIHSLSALEGDFPVGRLPYSMKVLLENLLRHHDGVTVTDDDVAGLAGRAATTTSGRSPSPPPGC